MRKNKSWCVGTLLIVAAFLLSSCGTFPNRPEEPMHTYVPGTVTLSNDTWEDTRDLLPDMGRFCFSCNPRQHPIVGAASDLEELGRNDRNC